MAGLNGNFEIFIYLIIAAVLITGLILSYLFERVEVGATICTIGFIILGFIIPFSINELRRQFGFISPMEYQGAGWATALYYSPLTALFLSITCTLTYVKWIAKHRSKLGLSLIISFAIILIVLSISPNLTQMFK